MDNSLLTLRNQARQPFQASATRARSVNMTGSSNSTLTLYVPIGSTPRQTYYVYHQVDADNEYVEQREDDNVVYTGVSFRIRTTGCP